MKDSNELILGDIIKLTRSSEKKFKLGNFKGAIDDKMKANAILKSKSCDEKIIEKYREELSRLYSSKFDLIFDHKLKIDEIKRNQIVKMLEQKSKEKLKSLDYKGAIKAFRFSKDISFLLLLMVMPQSTLESLLFFLILSLLATYIVNLKYSSKLKIQK